MKNRGRKSRDTTPLNHPGENRPIAKQLDRQGIE